jgi:two-component system OmpR family response regulator
VRILLVEDTSGLGDAIREHLEEAGHAVDWVRELEPAAGCLRTTPYDLILLDLRLPDGSGLDFLRYQRGKGATMPIIILTARDQVSDRVAGLDAGADDYLVKPFQLVELSARVAAVARRYSGNPNPVVRIGELTIDLAARRVERGDRAVELTGREWALLEAFLQHPGALLSRSRLEDSLYAFGAEIESNTIEVYISRLRKKLGRETIETVRGMGYRMNTA